MEKPIKEVIQRIAFESQESGATKWQVLKVIKELEEIAGGEKQLRNKAAEILEEINPDAAKTFLSFERMKVFTSLEKREAFDRGNIIKSLLKETNISRAVAEKIGSEVEDQIKDLNIDYLNTQLIREMVSVKLLEYGHEKTHGEYLRIGMPVFEIGKKLEEGFFENPEILREYNWNSIINAKARELHFDSLIHIFNPEDFSTKIFSNTKFLPGTIEEITLNAGKLDKQSSFPIILQGLNYAVKIKNTSKKKVLEETNRIIKVLEISGKRMIELSLFADYEWEELNSRKTNSVMFANNLLLSKQDSFELVISVDSKYKLKLLEKNVFNNKFLITNNSQQRIIPNPISVSKDSLIIQLVGLNLLKIFEIGGSRENGFFSHLEQIIGNIDELVEKKKSILKKREYIEDLEKVGKGIALAGLLNISNLLNETNPSKGAEKIISFIQKKGFSLMEMPEEIVLKRFGFNEDRLETQEILLGMNSRERKNYGFKYKAGSIKEIENLLSDCPLIEFIPEQSDNS